MWWMSYFTHGVVDVWCGGCLVWWMSGVVDVWSGGCPSLPMVWWMSGVVDVGVVDVCVVDVVQSALGTRPIIFELGRGGCTKTRANPGIAKIGLTMWHLKPPLIRLGQGLLEEGGDSGGLRKVRGLWQSLP